MSALQITAFGQTGFLFKFQQTRILIDPYLTEYVADKYGEHLKRVSPSKIEFNELSNIDLILITHSHEDHCDPLSLAELIKINPSAKILGSYDCAEVLESNGIGTHNFGIADEGTIDSRNSSITIRTVPSAHTELEFSANGHSKFLGYVLDFGGTVIYHAGDTIPHEKITKALEAKTIDFAFLPINERNYFREREGIIGNMSPKEALLWAEELKVKTLIPTHWDTFEPNSTHPEELNLLYNKRQYDFNLKWLEIDQTISINKNDV